MPMPNWRCLAFTDLDAGLLHDILALRQAVFVVEQACAFAEIDGFDRAASHIAGHAGGRLAAYARILPAGVKHAEVSIGRVAVDAAHRGRGLGRAVMREAIRRAPAGPIRIAAQARLADGFYASLGFRRTGSEYDEDGIAHVDMLLRERRAG